MPGCGQDVDSDVSLLREMLQQLEKDVHSLSVANQQLSDELTNQRSDVEVATLITLSFTV